MKQEQNGKRSYESPEIDLHYLIRDLADFLKSSDDVTEVFEDDSFEFGFGFNF